MCGSAGDSVISGVFIVRGPEIKPVVEVAPDWESYNYERIDPFVEGPAKTFFEGAMAWDLEVNGKKWVDGKNVSVFNSLVCNPVPTIAPQFK